jgi:AAA domain
MEWLIEDLLPLSYLAVVGATSKCGKSCFITNMADAVTHGTPFLGKKTLKCPILWVACEESEAERAMVLSLYPDVSNNYLLTHQRVSLDSPESINALRWWVRKSKAKLIVIDPLYGAIEMQSISKGVEGRSSLKDLKELCRVENVSAVVLHHTNKNVSVGMTRERFADSGQILAVASTDWLIEARIKPDGTRDLMMSTTGRGAFANKRLLIHSPSLTEYELVAEGTGDSVFTEDRNDDLVRELQKHQNGLTAMELAQTLRLQPRTTQNRLTQLLRQNEIVVLEKRGKASVYGVAQEELGLAEEGG